MQAILEKLTEIILFASAAAVFSTVSALERWCYSKDQNIEILLIPQLSSDFPNIKKLHSPTAVVIDSCSANSYNWPW
jgi:hypothetical protein